MAGSGWAILPLRLVVGLVFVMHGGQKLFQFGIGGTTAFMGQLGLPLPGLAALVVIAVELLGGLAILLGLFTRLTAALLAFDVLVALLTVHLRSGFFVPDGIEFVLTLLGGALSLAGLGPGPLSLDGRKVRSR
ncbi:MAG TPA: DoxX family protein [Methylomirabilota bacterium]|nr:DoxX family protein [Methylomirabilota bacterium]